MFLLTFDVTRRPGSSVDKLTAHEAGSARVHFFSTLNANKMKTKASSQIQLSAKQEGEGLLMFL